MRKFEMLCLAVLFCSAPILFARDLSQDDLKLLQDPAGWQYITITDPDNGIQTKHTCFDGQPHPNVCSGILIFRSDSTFTQTVYVHGRSVRRHGRYQVDGEQVTFFDEFGTADGPYTIALNPDMKTLDLDSQAVHIELKLETAYRSRSKKTSRH
jgi:hypothetical protein